MKKFKSMIGAVLVLSMLGLSACGPKVEGDSAKVDATEETQTTDANATEETQVAGDSDEKITLKVVDWSDSTKIQRDEFHKKFMEEHPNINIEYTLLTMDQFKNTALTAIKSGDAPDLFPVPNGMKLGLAVSENWFAPMEDYVTEDFLSTINEMYMLEGYQKIEDKLYVLPENVGIANPFIYYNKDILEEAGINPEEIKTYTDFTEACKTITEKGAGKYYGIIEGGNQLGRWEVTARGFAGVAGGFAGRTNEAVVRNGRSIYDTPEMVGVVSLFKQLGQDESYHPDTINISAPEARAMFAQGQAGFLVQGIWCVATWERENPDFNFGVIPVPAPDTGAKGMVARESPQAWMGISKTSKNPEAAGEYLMALYGEGYQGACVSGGGFISIIDEYTDKYLPEGGTREYYDVAMNQMRTAPDPLYLNSKVTDFYVEVKDIQPSLSAIMQGAVAGSIDDVEGTLKELSDNSTVEWTRAAEAVGLELSDFEFENWDPMEDYTEEMYAGK